MQKQPPQLLFRVSEQALNELDAAADRNGRSRNAEAAARIERSLGSESPYPTGRALLAFVSELTTRVLGQGLIEMTGPDGSEDELQTLKGALCALLDGLGADKGDPKGIESGANFGKRFLLDARLALAKEPSRRSPAEELIAEAATAWGLKTSDVYGSVTFSLPSNGDKAK